MSTYLQRSTESEREYEAKLAQARERHGRPFAPDTGSDFKPHKTPFLTQWLKGEVNLGVNDAPGT